MAGDKSEVAYPLNAQQNAAIKTWKICMVGMSDVNGQIWVSSELIDLEIAAPYVLASTNMAASNWGKNGAVAFALEQKMPFEGKAKAKLLGLPANVTADEVEISSADTAVTFPVVIGEKAPVGSHNSLYCAIAIMKNGEPMVHNIGQGARRCGSTSPSRPRRISLAPVVAAPPPKQENKPAASPCSRVWKSCGRSREPSEDDKVKR